MVIDKQKTEEEEDDKCHKSNIAHQMGSAMTLVIDDNILNEMEKCGFPRTYIVNSLNNDDLNYASTFYHLLTTAKEYWFIITIKSLSFLEFTLNYLSTHVFKDFLPEIFLFRVTAHNGIH